MDADTTSIEDNTPPTDNTVRRAHAESVNHYDLWQHERHLTDMLAETLLPLERDEWLNIDEALAALRVYKDARRGHDLIDICELLRTGRHTRYVTINGAVAVAAADMIEATQAEIERLQAERDAINLLHRASVHGVHDEGWCNACDVAWPCKTARLLRSEEARHD